MKYKIGDKVKIREDLKAGDYFGDYIANGHMTPYAGKIATIKRVGKDSYGIDLDGKVWNWTLEMFEKIGVKEGMMVVRDTGVIGIVSWGRRTPYVRFNDGTWSYVGDLDVDRVCFYEEVDVEI